jgi:hypothetical protein
MHFRAKYSRCEPFQENTVLHVRCTRLQELATAAEEQIMRQADTIRRLEYCVDPDAACNVHLQLAQAQRFIQELHRAVDVRVCYYFERVLIQINRDFRSLLQTSTVFRQLVHPKLCSWSVKACLITFV